MAGLVRIFRTMAEAIAAGFTVYDRTASGYLVRQKVAGRWHLAIVDLTLTRRA